MSEIKIVANNQWREFICSCDLSPKEKEEFDYMGDIEEGTFLRYRGRVYSLDCFMSSCPIEGWDGIYNDTFFSGTLIKISDCGSMYKIGTYYS